jgi:Bacteriophage tail sheath protein
MATMKTPGVYIVEKNAFPNSVVEVETAVPAFIGYTEKASNRGAPLLNKPFRISSMAEFETYFGGPQTPTFKIMEAPNKPAKPTDPVYEAELFAQKPDPKAPDGAVLQGYAVVQDPASRRLLYFAMRHFFQNGGGPCYIVSVGDYAAAIDPGKLTGGLEALTRELEPTMVVVPDAVLLDQPNCIGVQQQMLAHCGEVMKNRVAILDIYNGDKSKNEGDPIAVFRDSLGVNNLMFGAAYYPWVHTTIVQDRDLSYTSFAGGDAALADLISANMAPSAREAFKDVLTAARNTQAAWEKAASDDWDKQNPGGKPADKVAWVAASQRDWIALRKAQTNATLYSTSDTFVSVVKQAARHVNLMPPSAAMAGVYTMVDNSRGVWKAPANVSLNSVVAPAVSISNEEQADLNVTATGKSINAIRAFIGEGVLVWGARTLDGNSLDWRYINVRRTMIMLEESCRLAAKAMVFEPNVAGTWTTIKSMIANFLTGVWKRGGLAGAVPEDAFSVFVGLGETMTSEDILEGILRVTVLVAISRPAEFIEITFQQQMQKS